MLDIFNLLKKYNLTPNQFYLLYSMKYKIKTDNFINISLELKRLKNDKWVKEDNKMADKAMLVVDQVESFFKVQKKRTSTALMGPDCIKKIKEYSEIFPKFKLPSGKYARTNIKTLEAGFRWFFSNFDYKWETILKATKIYVEEYEMNNYKYMRTSQYFVRKQMTDKSYESPLADYCEAILNGVEEQKNHFKEKVV
tara:strand:+ start:4222 stop:4809 length:588 start_codon:yes stop_codon:yes gene_type:complete